MGLLSRNKQPPTPERPPLPVDVITFTGWGGGRLTVEKITSDAIATANERFLGWVYEEHIQPEDILQVAANTQFITTPMMTSAVHSLTVVFHRHVEQG
jgi:hypothetical protein